jgi:general stress protein 26
VNRREQIWMTSAELGALLAERRVVSCGTIGPRGWPDLMPLWYLVRHGEIWTWTYAKSQKVRNLERDPRASRQVGHGEQHHELPAS